MAERIQYPALDDLETVIRSLSRTSKGPVAAIFDPKRGWCVTDEVTVVESKHGALEVAFTCQSYKDWFRESVSEACAQLFAVRFIPGTLLGKLFKVAVGAVVPGKQGGTERKQGQPAAVAAAVPAAIPAAVPAAKRPGQEGRPGSNIPPGGARREADGRGVATQGRGGQTPQQTTHVPKHRPTVTGQSGDTRSQPPPQTNRIPAATSFLPRKAVKPSQPVSTPKVTISEKPARRERSGADDFPELPV